MTLRVAGRNRLVDRDRQAELLDARQRRVEVRVGERGDFRRAQFQVLESRRLRGVDVFERRADADLDAAILS